MTDYRKILRLKELGISERNIAKSSGCSRNTVSKAIKRANELGLSWPLPETMTNPELENIIYPKNAKESIIKRKMPDLARIRKELQKKRGKQKTVVDGVS